MRLASEEPPSALPGGAPRALHAVTAVLTAMGALLGVLHYAFDPSGLLPSQLELVASATLGGSLCVVMLWHLMAPGTKTNRVAQGVVALVMLHAVVICALAPTEPVGHASVLDVFLPMLRLGRCALELTVLGLGLRTLRSDAVRTWIATREAHDVRPRTF